MKFGETLAKNKLEGWKYIDYMGLKQLIKESTTQEMDKNSKLPHWSSIFLSQLILQIGSVNSFFLGIESMLKSRTQSYDKTQDMNGIMAKQLSKMMTDLCKYVVLNYIAVLKICKKHDKHSKVTLMGEVKQVLFTSDFFLSLSNSDLFRNVNEMVKSISTTTSDDKSKVGKSCPICNESMNIGNTSLPCGHCICWTCLAEATWKTHRQCPLCRKEQVVDPVNLEITTILGALSQHYFPFNIDEELDGISDEEAETKTRVKEEKKSTIKSTSSRSSTSDSDSSGVVYGDVLSSSSLDMQRGGMVTTTNDKKRRRKRKRPFGSIRCSKCNKFGLEDECCGAKYHVVIRVRRVPQHVRSALLKRAFNTYDEADEARLKIEQMYPKLSSSRKSRRKNLADKSANQKRNTTTEEVRSEDSKSKMEKKMEMHTFPSPDLAALSGDGMSPLLMGSSEGSPRLRQGSFDLNMAKGGDSRERRFSSSATSIASVDSNNFMFDLRHQDFADSNLPGDDRDSDLVSNLYNQVMLAEARAHAAVQQANLNQNRCRTLEVKLAQTQKNLETIITRINKTPREGNDAPTSAEEGPPRLRTQSMEWQLSSPNQSPSKNSVAHKSPMKLSAMPDLSSELFSLLDDTNGLSEFTEFNF